ncbi:hypothetical protein GO283_00582 [Ralstonia solanacearum]|nr:hypothetical protein [Ralstonia solanacearum]
MANLVSNVPDWLLSFHRARESGLTIRGRYIVIQAGGRIGKFVPAVSVTPGYKPHPSHNFSAFAGLDCELIFDDQTSFALASGLVSGILKACPRRLLGFTFGRHPVFLSFKKGGGNGA